MVYELLDTEGLYIGASTALNVVAAVELAGKLGKGPHNPLLVLRVDLYRLQAQKSRQSCVMVPIVTRVVCFRRSG
jgi:cysteine synthase A